MCYGAGWHTLTLCVFTQGKCNRGKGEEFVLALGRRRWEAEPLLIPVPGPCSGQEAAMALLTALTKVFSSVSFKAGLIGPWSCRI